MARAEPAGIPDRVKLRTTSKVKQAVARRMRDAAWCDAARGRHGAETTLPLSGWSRARRAVVLRGRVKADLAVVDYGDPEPLRLRCAELTDRTILYENTVPATALPHEILCALLGGAEGWEAPRSSARRRATGCANSPRSPTGFPPATASPR
jgi:hypothetical protein